MNVARNGGLLVVCCVAVGCVSHFPEATDDPLRTPVTAALTGADTPSQQPPRGDAVRLWGAGELRSREYVYATNDYDFFAPREFGPYLTVDLDLAGGFTGRLSLEDIRLHEACIERTSSGARPVTFRAGLLRESFGLASATPKFDSDWIFASVEPLPVWNMIHNLHGTGVSWRWADPHGGKRPRLAVELVDPDRTFLFDDSRHHPSLLAGAAAGWGSPEGFHGSLGCSAVAGWNDTFYLGPSTYDFTPRPAYAYGIDLLVRRERSAGRFVSLQGEWLGVNATIMRATGEVPIAAQGWYGALTVGLSPTVEFAFRMDYYEPNTDPDNQWSVDYYYDTWGILSAKVPVAEVFSTVALAWKPHESVTFALAYEDWLDGHALYAGSFEEYWGVKFWVTYRLQWGGGS